MTFLHQHQPQVLFSLQMTLNVSKVSITSFYAERSAKPNNMVSVLEMNFNVAKCALLRFSSGCPSVIFNYTINDNLISAQETHRDLGIIISSYISLIEREHMKSILYAGLTKLSTLFTAHLVEGTEKILYLSLICLQLTYYRLGILAF